MKRSATRLIYLGRFSWYRLTAVMLPLLVVGIGVTWFLHASGTPVGFEAESGALAGGAAVVSVTGQSGSGAVKFGAAAAPTPTPTPTPGGTLTGWQLTTSNIGLAPSGKACTSLPAYTGSDKPTSGTVISGKLISDPLDLSNGNISIDHSCIRPTSTGVASLITTSDYDSCGNNCPTPAKGPVSITDSEIDGSLVGTQDISHDCAFMGVGDLERNYIHDTGSGICFFGTGQTLTAAAINNYVDHMRAYGNPATTGSHNETFTIRDYPTATSHSRSMMVRGNYFNIDSGNDTGALFIQAYGDFIDNVTVQDNLLTGQGYQLILEANANGYGTHMDAINNRFSGTGYGVGYHTGGPDWAVWTNNYLNDPAKPNNQGAVAGEP